MRRIRRTTGLSAGETAIETPAAAWRETFEAWLADTTAGLPFADRHPFPLPVGHDLFRRCSDGAWESVR